jgi:hypothetical protein
MLGRTPLLLLLEPKSLKPQERSKREYTSQHERY